MKLAPIPKSFEFAGFTWPRYLADMAEGPAALRVKRELRKHCGNYYHAPKPNARGGQGFYLDSSGQPFTRWEWAGDIVNLDHNGWYTDPDGCGDTIKGIVARLPHGRFLAGWSMGKNMASAVDDTLYDDAKDAARAADQLAERIAEDEMQRQYELEMTE